VSGVLVVQGPYLAPSSSHGNFSSIGQHRTRREGWCITDKLANEQGAVGSVTDDVIVLLSAWHVDRAASLHALLCCSVMRYQQAALHLEFPDHFTSNHAALHILIPLPDNTCTEPLYVTGTCVLHRRLLAMYHNVVLDQYRCLYNIAA